MLDRVRAALPDVDRGALDAILARIEDDYFRKFPPETIASHVRTLLMLSSERPVAVLFDEAEGRAIGCTVLAFDHPFEFSSITGLMAGTGFSIESTEAFTLPRVRTETSTREALRRATTSVRRRDPKSDAVIIDHFRGSFVGGPVQNFHEWSRTFESALTEVIRLLDRGDEASTERAKRVVNERVTQWLESRGRRRTRESLAAGSPIDVAIEQLPHATRLRLRGPDVPAFLYALSTALSLHGLQIEKTRIQTIDGQAVDEIDLVDRRGKPLVDPDRLQQLRLSILLTQQFAYFLDRAPDPFMALHRFEELAEKIVQQSPQRDQWLALLSDPASMADLAKVLGASDYLWEDFIRSHADALLPAVEQHVRGGELCPPSRSLPRRLGEALAGAKTIDEQRIALNRFKDRELFLIDLDHILTSENPDAAFQVLSERLVLVAETLVATAAKLVNAELMRRFGTPRDDSGRDVAHAIFGLGKLGGVALGYASDIELLFLYDAPGATSGGAEGAIDNREFFAQLTRQTADFIQAKREGIFQVDLRLRPYGKGGPLATSREQFAEYYRAGGAAHAFERLALVRLRWIAGDARLGFAIEQLRDELLYDGQPIDLDAIWDVLHKMRVQRLGSANARQLNSKYSSGGLSDLEGVVQLLQVTHGAEAPQLRTPRLHEAIESLRRAGVLSPLEFDELMAAYQFLRRLINAQRMLRGSAQDLILAPEKSDELVHLARRMNYRPSHEQGDAGFLLLSDFQRHTNAVRQFIRSRFGREAP